MGIRFDGNFMYFGVVVFFYYDFLLIKVISYGVIYRDVVIKLFRVLREFRIRGVKVWFNLSLVYFVV